MVLVKTILRCASCVKFYHIQFFFVQKTYFFCCLSTELKDSEKETPIIQEANLSGYDYHKKLAEANKNLQHSSKIRMTTNKILCSCSKLRPNFCLNFRMWVHDVEIYKSMWLQKFLRKIAKSQFGTKVRLIFAEK